VPKKRTPAPLPPANALREVLGQVRRIELRTRRLVNSLFSGEYHSVFKGQGIEFAEVREYLPGDDVRTIDWNVTARLGQPYVKRYVEERELSVLLAVDLSGSQHWGTRSRFKSDVVAEVLATLAMSAIRNNDRVGLLGFTEGVELFVPPRKGRRHVLRLLRDLLVLQPVQRGTDLATPLAYAGRVLPTRSVLFLLSDFQPGASLERFERELTAAVSRHDVVAIRLTDPGEARLPAVGLLEITDPESGRRFIIDTGSPAVRDGYAEQARRDNASVAALFRRLGVDEITLQTDVPYASALLGFFRRRERRIRR
jgi:uncharacterized protein (DUF58 family)